VVARRPSRGVPKARAQPVTYRGTLYDNIVSGSSLTNRVRGHHLRGASWCLRRSAEGASGDDGAGVLGEDLACFFIGQPLKPAAELAGAEVV
jgi:hypothetical protein